VNDFRRKVPEWPLAEFVACLWYSKGEPPAHDFERILPDGSVEIVLNLREDRMRVYNRHSNSLAATTRGAIVSGPRSDYFVIDTAQQLCTIGIHFRAGGAFPFLGVPATEVQNQQIALHDLWGRAAIDMREDVLEAASVDQKFAVLEGWLLRQAAHLHRHPAVAYALREFCPGRGRSVTEVIGQIGVSPKRFIQLFQKEVGLTPKLFCRVRRFQKVLHAIGMGQPIEWAGVAIDCGYFDQAHFNHDFRSFAGLNPSSYVAQRTEHLNHVPLTGIAD
jgi:AraC-like DNA-binding protein